MSPVCACALCLYVALCVYVCACVRVYEKAPHRRGLGEKMVGVSIQVSTWNALSDEEGDTDFFPES